MFMELSNAPKPVLGQHPGKHLREILEFRGWIQEDLAFILGRPSKGLSLIFNEKCGISPEMSKALGHALGLPEDYFAGLQKAYELACANEPSPTISIRAKIKENYPIREMIKRGWLKDPDKDNDAKDLGEQLAQFFEVRNSNEIPYLAHAAKKTNYEEKEIPPAQLAWLFRVKQLARAIVVPKYSAENLMKALERMRQMLVAPEETRHVPRLLSECGVRFIMVEGLPKSKIDGVSFWLDESSPVIGLSSRFDRIDNFWFVLRHEIEHVLKGHGKEIAMIDSELEQEHPDLPEEEKMANKAAADFCISSEKIESFIRRKNPFYYEKDVVAFSKLNRVHPGLVVGQIQHRIKRYDYLRNYQVKVRQFVLPGSMSDGWGQTASVTLGEGENL